MFNAAFVYDCPFCPGRYAIVIKPPALLHTAPGCPHFRQTEPEVYLIDAREAEEETAEAARAGGVQ